MNRRKIPCWQDYHCAIHPGIVAVNDAEHLLGTGIGERNENATQRHSDELQVEAAGPEHRSDDYPPKNIRSCYLERKSSMDLEFRQFSYF